MERVLKWICGFANASGGKLVVVKNDKGKIVGLENARELLEMLTQQSARFPGRYGRCEFAKISGQNFQGYRVLKFLDVTPILEE
jgi:predicted HTH transcriptional regulator